jgi:hypothetical protein
MQSAGRRSARLLNRLYELATLTAIAANPGKANTL